MRILTKKTDFAGLVIGFHRPFRGQVIIAEFEVGIARSTARTKSTTMRRTRGSEHVDQRQDTISDGSHRPAEERTKARGAEHDPSARPAPSRVRLVSRVVTPLPVACMPVNTALTTGWASTCWV
jgi:hypothetical protein